MFSLKRADKGNNPAIKEFPAAAATYKVGDALVLTNGTVSKASGTTKPTHVAAGAGTLAANDILAVNPIYADMEFVTTLSAAGTALKKGDKVTIAETADAVTATTTGGVATIVEIIDPAAGGKVVVKFI